MLNILPFIISQAWGLWQDFPDGAGRGWEDHENHDDQLSFGSYQPRPVSFETGDGRTQTIRPTEEEIVEMENILDAMRERRQRMGSSPVNGDQQE